MAPGDGKMSNRFHEMIVRGSRGRTRGFLEGYLAERAIERPMIVADEEGFACETFRERVRDLLRPDHETLHLLVPAGLAGTIRRTIAAAVEAGVEAEIVGEREVEGARFAFRFRVYSRKAAIRVRSHFESLPEGVRLDPATEFEEIVDPHAKGIEGYAPVHEYELRGTGSVEGTIPGVLEVHRRCRDDELVDAESIEIVA